MDMRSHNFEFLHSDELLGSIWEHKREKKEGKGGDFNLFGTKGSLFCV
jgi:hypothetical protein